LTRAHPLWYNSSMNTSLPDLDYTFHDPRSGRTWHILERADGSARVSYYPSDRPLEYVVYDSKDNVWHSSADELTDTGLTYRQLDAALKA
jgi:hypothetical protein